MIANLNLYQHVSVAAFYHHMALRTGSQHLAPAISFLSCRTAYTWLALKEKLQLLSRKVMPGGMHYVAMGRLACHNQTNDHNDVAAQR